MTAIEPLLSGIVDYAGLFPPAGLDMTAAVGNYTDYRIDRDSWMLGRFVVPVARLDEFSAAFSSLNRGDGEWRLAALAGDDVPADIARIAAFNATHRGRAAVDTIEGKLSSPSAIGNAAVAAAGIVAVYAEIPIDHDPASLISAIADGRINAKIRTGGVTADAFPSARNIVRFMRRCREAGVPFKATAGLHHPLRAEYRLTYAADAPTGLMYGYLNVFLTAALLNQLADDEAIALLEERDPRAIVVMADAVCWREHALRASEIASARELVVSSFGSCSFREPVDELRSLSFLT